MKAHSSVLKPFLDLPCWAGVWHTDGKILRVTTQCPSLCANCPMWVWNTNLWVLPPRKAGTFSVGMCYSSQLFTWEVPGSEAPSANAEWGHLPIAYVGSADLPSGFMPCYSPLCLLHSAHKALSTISRLRTCFHGKGRLGLEAETPDSSPVFCLSFKQTPTESLLCFRSWPPAFCIHKLIWLHNTQV